MTDPTVEAVIRDWIESAAALDAKVTAARALCPPAEWAHITDAYTAAYWWDWEACADMLKMGIPPSRIGDAMTRLDLLLARAPKLRMDVDTILAEVRRC